MKRQRERCGHRVTLALLLGLLCGPAARADVRRLVVVHTNDLHGHLFPGPDHLTPGEPKPRMGGIAAVAAVIEAERARAAKEGSGFLALDAGDLYHGAPEGDRTRGRAVIDVLNLVGYDAVCIGNHELEDGVENVEGLARAARFPLLAANVYRDRAEEPGTDESPWLGSMIVKETGGLKVAVIGALTEVTPRMSRSRSCEGLGFRRVADVLPALVARARTTADVVVALTHEGSDEDQKLARELAGCALIVGGHDHVALEPARLVGDTLIVQAGEHGRRVGRVRLDVDTGLHRVVRREATLVNLLADAPVSATVAAAAEACRVPGLDEPIGRAAEAIPRFFSGESPAGALACEAVRHALGADVSFFPPTTVRGGFSRGAVTGRDVYAAVPFQDELVAVEVGARAIREVLEQALDRPGEPGLLVSGLLARYDPRRPRGQRLVDVLLGEAPLARDRRYRLATTDFFAERSESLSRRRRERSGKTAFDVLRAEFAERSPVSPPAVDRHLLAIAPSEHP